MLETRTLERVGFDTALPADQPGSSAELRPLRWAEITARLAAARDLRLLLRAAAEDGGNAVDGPDAESEPSAQK